MKGGGGLKEAQNSIYIVYKDNTEDRLENEGDVATWHRKRQVGSQYMYNYLGPDHVPANSTLLQWQLLINDAQNFLGLIFSM